MKLPQLLDLAAGGPGSGRHPSGGTQAKSESILRRYGYEKTGSSNGESHFRHQDGQSAVVNRGGYTTHDPGPKGKSAGFNLAVRSHDKLGGYLKQMHSRMMDSGGPGSGRYASGAVKSALKQYGFKSGTAKMQSYHETANMVHPDGHTAHVGKGGDWAIQNKAGQMRLATPGSNVSTIHSDLSDLGISKSVQAGGPGSGRKPGSGGFSQHYQNALDNAKTASHIANSAYPSERAHREAATAHQKAYNIAKSEDNGQAAYHQSRMNYHTNRANSYNSKD